MMTKAEHIEYWINCSTEDWLTAKEISEKNERRFYALFIGHLSIEKLLKAIYVKINDSTPPFIHDLVYLAKK